MQMPPNEMERYVLEEHVEDFRDGLINRRELLRRVTLITGSAALTMTVLSMLGCNVNQAPRASTAPTAAEAAAATARASAAASADPLPYATPPAAATTGVTVQPTDARIVAARVDVKAADGASLIGYFARPSAAGKFPGVVVIHENRGLTEHIRDVTRRFATAGFAAVAIDVLSRVGGADRLEGGAYSAALVARTLPDQVADEKAALDFLVAQPQLDAGRVGVTGYCFGGGVTWSCINAGLGFKAAAPFYGPKPADISGLAKTKTNVLGVFAELDTRITSAIPDFEAQLKLSGAAFQMNVYKGANHAFHNDTGERFVPDQARTAWKDTVEWLRKYV